MPFVDLALSETKSLRDSLDKVSRPVRVLLVLILKNLDLLLILSLPSLNISISSTIGIVLSFLEELGDTLIQIFDFESMAILVHAYSHFLQTVSFNEGINKVLLFGGESLRRCNAKVVIVRAAAVIQKR